MARPRRYALAVELTSHCNQRCSYCYNDWRGDNGRSVGAMASGDLLALLDRALAEVEFDHVTLTGGEPLARADFFAVMDLLRRHETDAFIISNGGLVRDEIAARLSEYSLRGIQVTLNSTRAEEHDEVVGGRHFAATIEGVRALREHGVPVVGSIVVTRKNAAQVGDILDLWRELGVSTVALSRFSPAGYAAQHVAELLPSRGELVVALEAAEQRGAAGMDLQVTLPMPPCMIDHADYPHVSFGSCPIGTEMQEFALGPRGELRSCTLHTEPLGDAKVQSLAELVSLPALAAYRDVTPEFCAPCPHRSECMGGCGAAAASVLGDPRGLDPIVAQHVDEAFAARLAREREGLSPRRGLPVLA
ncbi:radical SAM/SPASM domain-containing protein [Nannocystaceae bacterium ST9]